jgi:hypothetical protein
LVILLSRKTLTSKKPKDIIKLLNNTKHEIVCNISRNVKLLKHHGRQDMERGRTIRRRKY